MDYSDRITLDPAICHGKPCIRGLRYPVENLLELLAGGMTTDQILDDYADLERDGGTRWDGVRNFQARNHLRAMKKGDLVLLYHSQTDKAVVGVAEITREAYADPGAPSEDWSCVDLAPKKAFKRGVTLAKIKATPELATLPLIKQSRLSVMSIEAAAYAALVKLGS